MSAPETGPEPGEADRSCEPTRPLSAVGVRVGLLGGSAGAAAILALQRASGNLAVTRLLARAPLTPGDPQCAPLPPDRPPTLTAARFMGPDGQPQPTLEACYEDNGRLAAPATGEPVRMVQQALADLEGVTGNTYDLGPAGIDEKYGGFTARAVQKFKLDEGLGCEQFGDVGPGTMTRLNELFGSRVVPKRRPMIHRVAPFEGPEAGGTRVLITGDNLDTSTAVSFDGNPADRVRVVADPQDPSGTQKAVACDTPRGTGDVHVTVDSKDLGPSAPFAPGDDVFRYTPAPPPRIEELSPSGGPEDGGTPVEIRGENLDDVTSVVFDEVPAGKVRVVEDPRDARRKVVRCVSPAGKGDAEVKVESKAGRSEPVRFHYQTPPAPAVFEFFPRQGRESGFDRVVISGDNLKGVTQVIFGKTPADPRKVKPTPDPRDPLKTAVECLSPPGTGRVPITVQSPAGRSAPSLSDYLYTAPQRPTVRALSRHDGPETGGDRVVITGDNLGGRLTVRFGDSPAVPETVGLVADPSDPTRTAIECSTPAGRGKVHVTVETDGGKSPSDPDSTADAYTYTSPRLPLVEAILPPEGDERGGTPVVIKGENLAGVKAVRFDDNLAANVKLVQDPDNPAKNAIGCVTPPGTGAATVTVETITGRSTPGTGGVDRFRYTTPPPPRITGLEPPEGPDTGGNDVVIKGQNLDKVTSVIFGETEAKDVEVVQQQGPFGSETVVRCTAPPRGDKDKVPVIVAGDGLKSTPTGVGDEYRYVPPSPAKVFSVLPPEGPDTGGTPVTIKGLNLEGVTEVFFGSQRAEKVRVVQDPAESIKRSMVLCESPPGTGVAVVTVQSRAGRSEPSETGTGDRFTYTTSPRPGPPTVVLLTPGGGRRQGGTPVLISGANLEGVIKVKFANNEATAVALVQSPIDPSRKAIRCDSPAAEGDVFPLNVPVTVETSAGKSTPGGGLGFDRFTYR